MKNVHRKRAGGSPFAAWVEHLEPRALASSTALSGMLMVALERRHSGRHARRDQASVAHLSVSASIVGATPANTLLAAPPMAKASNPQTATPAPQLNTLTASSTSAPPLPVVPLGYLSAATSPAYDWHTQMVNGVLNVWAPDPSDFGATWMVTDPRALFGPTGVPDILAVHQTAIPDCYLFASDAALALTHPDQITSIVQNDLTGGWAVTFQYYTGGKYVPLRFHVSDTLSVALQQPADGQMWPLVIEKAYAAFRTWNGSTSADTMASIGYGYPATALAQLGEASQTAVYTVMTDQVFYDTLSGAVAAGEPVLFQTSSAATTMVASHVYAITGVYTDSTGVAWVTTYNPWGKYETHSEAELRSNGIGTVVIGMA